MSISTSCSGSGGITVGTTEDVTPSEATRLGLGEGEGAVVTLSGELGVATIGGVLERDPEEVTRTAPWDVEGELTPIVVPGGGAEDAE